MCVIKSTCASFQALILFIQETHYAINEYTGITWAYTRFSISHSCQLKHLLHKNRRLDFHTITRNWPAIYTLYILQNICKLNEYIKLILVSINGHYCCMYRLAEKRTQWPTFFRDCLRNSEVNRYEICTRSRLCVKIEVSNISSESVKFHSMILTMMFKFIFS